MVFVAAFAALLAASPPLGDAASPGRACSSDVDALREFFVLDIRVRHVSCRAARRFIVAVNENRRYLKVEETHFRRYACRPYEESVPATRITCTRGQQWIRWLTGT
ncbi:MAG: hypothetical protein JSS68_14270 [Actinobacteria bacterium]|nr:hypothetical protein [Actinomycetota bacterium]MBS1883724.1 hypothetical protein [Actinomycetota bacterium]